MLRSSSRFPQVIVLNMLGGLHAQFQPSKGELDLVAVGSTLIFN
jgi:hypothetical protein